MGLMLLLLLLLSIVAAPWSAYEKQWHRSGVWAYGFSGTIINVICRGQENSINSFKTSVPGNKCLGEIILLAVDSKHNIKLNICSVIMLRYASKRVPAFGRGFAPY